MLRRSSLVVDPLASTASFTQSAALARYASLLLFFMKGPRPRNNVTRRGTNAQKPRFVPDLVIGSSASSQEPDRSAYCGTTNDAVLILSETSMQSSDCW